MRWDALTEVIAQAAAADPVLAFIYGETIRMAGTKAHEVPALEYQLISDVEEAEEIWAPHVIQWDQWTLNRNQLVASERALRRLFNHDIPVWFVVPGLEPFYMWSEVTDGANLISPSEWNYFGRAVRFEMTPVREDYVSAATS